MAIIHTSALSVAYSFVVLFETDATNALAQCYRSYSLRTTATISFLDLD